jgi:hypothetical protein
MVSISRRAAWVLVALGAWTLYVWITRIWIIAGQHNSAGFVVVHVTLAVISIAFGVAAAWIGWKALRAGKAQVAAPEPEELSARR